MIPVPHWHVKGFSSKSIAYKLEADGLQDQKIYCLQATPCIFEPGNLTGWGSEGVNTQSRVAHFIPWAHTGNCVGQNSGRFVFVLIGRGFGNQMKVIGPGRSSVGQGRNFWQCVKHASTRGFSVLGVAGFFFTSLW